MHTSAVERFWGATFGLMLLVFLGGAGVAGWYALGAVGGSSTCITGEPRTYVRPLAGCSVSTREGVTIGERLALSGSIEEYIKTEKSDGRIAEAAVYFRDLSEGPWFGVDEDAEFVPASLMKLPLAMWFFKDSETHPQALDAEIDFFAPGGTTVSRFPAQQELVPGTRYTIRELIRFLVAESSNEASKILAEYAGLANRNTVFADLDMPLVVPENDYQIDVRTYAAFFRVLYNASYLSRASSDELLSLMAEASFREGLVRGVPSGTRVAHKFGEYPGAVGDPDVQLHDCGVVYAPEQPYVLCVMTRGNDYENLTKVISQVSRMVYETVTAK